MPLFAATRETDAEGQDVLVVSGDVDLATAHEFVAAADAWTASRMRGPVRLDLSGVTFLDSSGISALLEIRRAATSAGTDVVLVDQSATVGRVLALAGIAELFVADDL